MPKRGVPGAIFFTRQPFRPRRRCEESRHLATPGAAAGNRASANAVGRRSSFLRGRVHFAPCTSLRPRRNGDAGSPAGRARRPGTVRGCRDAVIQPRPSGACKHTPARPFPGGASVSASGGSRPSGKRPRRPTALAKIRLLTRSPSVATLDVVLNLVHVGRPAQDNIKNGTHRRRGALLAWSARFRRWMLSVGRWTFSLPVYTAAENGDAMHSPGRRPSAGRKTIVERNSW